MLSKRDVLAYLSRDELLAAADQFELTIAERRVKDQVVEAVASSLTLLTWCLVGMSIATRDRH